MPSPPPHSPDVLHLLGLAQTMPGQRVALPGTAASVLWLTQQQFLVRAVSLLCLQGEVLIDWPDGGFTRLRSGELCSLSEQASAVPAQQAALLLLLGKP